MKLKIFLLVASSLLSNACVDKAGDPSENFDPAYVAAEADKGNLAPLIELNFACTEEVKTTGKRGIACQAQDKAGELRKPMNIRF